MVRSVEKLSTMMIRSAIGAMLAMHRSMWISSLKVRIITVIDDRALPAAAAPTVFVQLVVKRVPPCSIGDFCSGTANVDHAQLLKVINWF